MHEKVEQSPGETAQAVLIAVPDDVLDELVDAELVEEIPTLRGPVLDAVVTVGVDSAALVTLLQTPDTIHVFAAWLHARVRRRRDNITITGNRGGKAVRLRVDGDVPVGAIAQFLTSAFGQAPEASPEEPANADPPK